MQTLKVIENYFITPVSQIAVWGKLGQCLTNLKTNFRALSMTIIICPLTPCIPGVCAIPLSTSLLLPIAGLGKSVQTPPCSSPSGRLKINPPKSTFRWALLRTTLKSIHQAKFILWCWCFSLFCFFTHRRDYKAFHKNL